MITDETSIFDVLGDFFYHHEDAVRAAALEVYVRRAFTSYEVTGVTNLRLHDNHAVLKFDFLLPQSHPNRCPLNRILFLIATLSVSSFGVS